VIDIDSELKSKVDFVYAHIKDHNPTSLTTQLSCLLLFLSLYAIIMLKRNSKFGHLIIMLIDLIKEFA